MEPQITHAWGVLAGGLVFQELGPTPDGKYQVGSTRRDPAGSGQLAEFKDVVLLDTSTHGVTVIHHLPTARHQVLFADADARWVVWTEASLQPSFEDWAIYTYDRLSGTTTSIATAALDRQGHPVPTPNVQPKVDHDRVVWSAGTAEEPVGSHVDSFVADLTSGAVKPMAHDAMGANISWPLAVVGRRAPGAAMGSRLGAIDLETGVEKDLGIEGATYLGVAGRSIAWIDQTFQAVFLRDLETGQDRTVVDYRSADPRDGPHLQFLSLSNRLITWDQRPAGSVRTGGARAYDRKLGILVDLSQSVVLGYVYLRDPFVAWLDGRQTVAQPDSALVIRSLDTRQLP